MANKLSSHDHILRTTMAQPEVIKEFFSNYLPSHIKKEVNLDSIKLQKNSFINDKLRMQITDLLYTAQFGEKLGYLYLLIEHQSTPDKLMPYRILRYKLSIMEHHLKITKNKELPIIYPLIFYSGKRTYNHSTNIFDLFGKQKKLAEDIFYKPYQLIDLQEIPDNKLKEQLWFGILARIMKHIYSKNILPYLKAIMPELKIIENYGNKNYTYSVISYLFEAGEIPDQEEFVETIKTGLSVKEDKVMTLAQQYEEKGRAQGITQGEIAATRRLAIKMLNKGLDRTEISELTEIPENDLQDLFKD